MKRAVREPETDRQAWEDGRRLPIGAEPTSHGTHFRVWAPAASSLEVAFVRSCETPPRHVTSVLPLTREADGHYSGWSDQASTGDLYLFRLDGDRLLPDPASRFQPAGPHGPSMIVDPAGFRWQATEWLAPGSRADVVYEMHIGTFSREGTWRGAIDGLARLAALGVTVLELMPVAESTGQFGWGYDGVSLFSPYHIYGTPDEMRAFVDAAHLLGLNVLLDVVYNHCGPDGCYLGVFSPDYFSTRHEGEWGQPINFDQPGSQGARELVMANARYWVTEFALDGLRLDATQAIFDASAPHIIAALIANARASTPRKLWFVAENEPQLARLARPFSESGYGADALWNDDFHHSARVAATGRRDAYYSDYEGTANEFVAAARHGYLYQGQYYSWQKKGRGSTSFDLSPRAFVCFLENHDQIANSLTGARLQQLCGPGRYRALSALLVLGPWIPMLFQGQEYGATEPFLYFADMPPELREGVRNGRAEFLSQFPGCAEFRQLLPDPCDRETFERSVLGESAETDLSRLYRDLLHLRHHEDAIAWPERLDGAVLTEHAFVLRYFGATPFDARLLAVNLGMTVRKPAIAEPLVAPPDGTVWRRVWDSERVDYGGSGLGEGDVTTGLYLVGESAVLFAPAEVEAAAEERGAS